MHTYKPLRIERLPLVDLALEDVEVVTDRNADGKLESKFHGGRLDGETLAGIDNAQELHERALRLARIAGPGRRG